MTAPAAHMTIQERARFAIEHRDVAHTPADLREIIKGLLAEVVKAEGKALLGAFQRTSDYPRVRYCHECGTVGEVGATFISCCPDGMHATYVHPEVADQARLGFLKLLANDQAEEGTPV